MSPIQLIETNSEIGAGTRGASLGVKAMKFASIYSGSDYFNNYPMVTVPDNNHLLFKSTSAQNAKNIEGLIEVLTNLCNTVRDTLVGGKFPIVLAGDHSNAAGTIAGIKAAHPDKRLGVIWVDAHADLHSPFTSPSGNIHGMPLAISLGEDNMSHQHNEPSDQTVKLWNDLKEIGGMTPKINYEDIVFIGLRDTEIEEDHLITANNIKNYNVTETRAKGILKVVEEVNDYLSDCDMIYVSFDVDGMDPIFVSHGTGTPVPVGFSEIEARRLLRWLMTNENVCCLEFTEVNPILDDKGNRMAETALRILEKSTRTILERLGEVNLVS